MNMRSGLRDRVEHDPVDGACHCGRVRFRVRLTGGMKEARRCSCSYCAMRGAVALTAKLGDLDITGGQEWLTLYEFNTKTAKHYFCSVCGIYTFHQRRSDPDQYGINAACLGISPFDFEDVPVNDGIAHPSDTGPRRSDVIGTLHFIPHDN